MSANGDRMGWLLAELRDDLPGIERAESGLVAPYDTRYGVLSLRIEWDDDVGSIRLAVPLAPPIGTGAPFFNWCLTMNEQYWDIKLALDDAGTLRVLADFDASPDDEVADLAERIRDRLGTIRELVEDDYVGWLLENELGTPAQKHRWESWDRGGEAN